MSLRSPTLLRRSVLSAISISLLLSPVTAYSPLPRPIDSMPIRSAGPAPLQAEDLQPDSRARRLEEARARRASAQVEQRPRLVERPQPTPVPAAQPARATTAVGGPAAAPPRPASAEACRYADLPTARSSYTDWATTLVDTAYLLPAHYAPSDLVDSSAAGLNGGYPLRSIIVGDLATMASDAAAAGAPLRLASGYRSYATQVSTFNYWVSVGGYEQALRTSARPGHSEHQLGTTIDVTGVSDAAPWEYADWAATPAGAWMKQNAWRYGFVLSYPRGVSAVSCYDYEPWHYRYVGRELAAVITGSGLVPRQWLLRQFGG